MLLSSFTWTAISWPLLFISTWIIVTLFIVLVVTLTGITVPLTGIFNSNTPFWRLSVPLAISVPINDAFTLKPFSTATKLNLTNSCFLSSTSCSTTKSNDCSCVFASTLTSYPIALPEILIVVSVNEAIIFATICSATLYNPSIVRPFVSSTFKATVWSPIVTVTTVLPASIDTLKAVISFILVRTWVSISLNITGSVGCTVPSPGLEGCTICKSWVSTWSTGACWIIATTLWIISFTFWVACSIGILFIAASKWASVR